MNRPHPLPPAQHLPPVTLRQPEDLTLEVFEQIAWDGRRLSLHPDLLAQIGDHRAKMMQALADGRTVYGVTTGMGHFADVQLGEEDRQRHQANLLLGRAVGGPPYLERGEARALVVARLAGFLSGHAGVTPDLCAYLVDRLNDDFVPAVPRTGAGCAGEVIPLAHAFQTFLGFGQVLAVDGSPEAAWAALAAREAGPCSPAAKEGLALLAGAPGALALAAGHRRSAAVLSRQLLVAAACAIDALRAPLSPYEPAVGELANDPLLCELLGRIGDLLAGSDQNRPLVQAPVSFRVIPQVLTHLERTLCRLEEDIRRSLGAVTDSPAFITDRFVPTGNFHAIGLTAGMDALAVALVQAAELAAQHIHRLLNSRYTGLADQLTPRPGAWTGLVAVHKRVVGSTNELRRLAAPAGVGLADTSLGQEDAMTFAFEAADKLRRVEELIREVVACELLVCRQAWYLRQAPVATGLQAYAGELEAAVEPVDRDRPLGNDISTLVALLASGRFQ